MPEPQNQPVSGAAQIVSQPTGNKANLKVVEVQKGDPGQGIDYLYVTVEADNAEAVVSQPAKQLAWETRKKHGMHNAGIEASGGPFAVNANTGKPISPTEMRNFKNRPPLKYRHTFRLTQAVI